MCLQNSYALRSQEFKVKKEYNGKVFGVNNNQGGILPCEWGKLQKASSSDISNNEKIKPGNNVSGNVYFDGTDIETSKENCDITIFDEFNLNKPILGLTYECNYNYEMNVAELYAVLDFSESYVSKDLENIVSKRKIMIGTYSVENLTTLAGVMFFNDAWIEKIEYQILPEFDRSDVTVFEPSEDEEEQCMHYFKEYIRYGNRRVCGNERGQL